MKTEIDKNLIISKIASYEDFIQLKTQGWEAEHKQLALEKKIKEKIEAERKTSKTQSVKVSGYCYPSQKDSLFNLKYKIDDRGNLQLNWRESLVSEQSKFNNRIRASVHLLDIECAGIENPRIYLPEQVTRLYRYITNNFSTVVGSEYLESEIPFGETRADGVRNEDLTNLSFDTNTFDIIFSLDIFEHIPDYQKAFEECCRVLTERGKLLFTVPFNYRKENTIRAVVRENGQIEHLLEPQYHGNPIDNQGVLCFQTFGWQLLEDLRNAGFDEAEAIAYWSDYYVYLGHWQLLFVAKKSKSNSLKNTLNPKVHPKKTSDFELTNYFEQGKLLVKQGNYRDAEIAFRQSLVKNKSQPNIHHHLGQALVYQGKLDEAVESYQNAIDLAPDRPWSYYNLGKTLVRQGKLDEAIESYTKALELDSSSHWGYYYLGEAFCQQGKDDEAISCYEQSLKLEPNFARAQESLKQLVNSQSEPKDYFDVGRQLKAEGKLKEAISEYRIGILVSPDNATLAQELGDLYKQEGDIEEALLCYEKAIQISPRWGQPYLKAQGLPLNESQLDRLIPIYRDSIAAEPSFYVPYLCLAKALTKKGLYEEACQYYQEVTYYINLNKKPNLAKKYWNQSPIQNLDFTIVGAGKCGTSSLYAYLVQHPRILEPAEKEIHFFSHNYQNGLDWYLSHFPSLLESPGYLTGEASTSYLECHNETEKLLYEKFPSVKLIAVLRNPVDRTISHYNQLVRRGRESRPLEEAIISEIEVLQGVEDIWSIHKDYWKIGKGSVWYSLYIFFLEKWMTYFPKEQFLILRSEDLFSNPEATMTQVFEFLNLPDYKLPSYPTYNAGGSSREVDDIVQKKLFEFFQPYNKKLELFLNQKFEWYNLD